MCCKGDFLIVLKTIYAFYGFMKVLIPIMLVILLMFDIFKIIISKSEDDAKKIKKVIFNRVVSSIVVFLIPTLVFLVLNTVVSDDIFNVSTIKDCWHSL